MIGNCDLALLQFGLQGLGGGSTYLIDGRFDLDPAPVPLPATALLLLAGLGSLGLARRRRLV